MSKKELSEGLINETDKEDIELMNTEMNETEDFFDKDNEIEGFAIGNEKESNSGKKSKLSAYYFWGIMMTILSVLMMLYGFGFLIYHVIILIVTNGQKFGDSIPPTHFWIIIFIHDALSIFVGFSGLISSLLYGETLEKLRILSSFAFIGGIIIFTLYLLITGGFGYILIGYLSSLSGYIITYLVIHLLINVFISYIGFCHLASIYSERKRRNYTVNGDKIPDADYKKLQN